MPFVNDQAFVDNLYSGPKKYKPFQDKSHIIKKEKQRIKIKKEHMEYIEMVQRELKEGKRQPVDINHYIRYNVDLF